MAVDSPASHDCAGRTLFAARRRMTQPSAFSSSFFKIIDHLVHLPRRSADTTAACGYPGRRLTSNACTTHLWSCADITPPTPEMRWPENDWRHAAGKVERAGGSMSSLAVKALQQLPSLCCCCGRYTRDSLLV